MITVGIAGLGLIGASAAKAFIQSGNKVFGFDISNEAMSFALMSGAVSDVLNMDSIKQCDLIILAIYPHAAAEYLENAAPHINKNAIVIDFCGTKRNICEKGFALAQKYGFTFAGGHPMAGNQYSGIKYSNPDLFKGSPMVIVPPVYDDISLLDKIKILLKPLAFKSISVTTAEAHDEVIAYTSELPHIVSNSFVKSPTAINHRGLSAGSYKDLTRVAWLNPEMWTELFFDNKDNLIIELRSFIKETEKYLTALETGNREEMIALLEDGKRLKEKVDGYAKS